jgi:hypothetical protein
MGAPLYKGPPGRTLEIFHPLNYYTSIILSLRIYWQAYLVRDTECKGQDQIWY